MGNFLFLARLAPDITGKPNIYLCSTYFPSCIKKWRPGVDSAITILGSYPYGIERLFVSQQGDIYSLNDFLGASSKEFMVYNRQGM
jgi:hypothetical protein